MAKKSTTSVVNAKPDELKEVRESFTRIIDLWEKDFERYKDDTKFMSGAHWPEKVRKQRDGDDRLSLVVDKLQQYKKQVVNNSRQNRPQIKVRPVAGGANVETAEIFDGLPAHSGAQQRRYGL
jgi:hypothetical protein